MTYSRALQVEWKLKRGKMRPLLRFAQAQVEADVIAATAAAFAALGDGSHGARPFCVCVLFICRRSRICCVLH